MYETQPALNNSLTEGTFLGSKYLNPVYLFNEGYTFFHDLFLFLVRVSDDVITIYYFLVFGLATFFLFIIFYCIIRMFEIRKKEHEHIHHEIEEYAHHMAEKEKKAKAGESGSTNPRWMKTLTYLYSNSSSDWKLAIIEADAMLDELMSQLGFRGETLGEKLKGADQGNFRNLTAAWEVHTIRNRIAHEGLSYEISQHEAKRVIAIYERIFQEFGYI